jgi:hypothetical protein
MRKCKGVGWRLKDYASPYRALWSLAPAAQEAEVVVEGTEAAPASGKRR